MSLDIRIVDGGGSGRSVFVQPDNSLLVSVVPTPPPEVGTQNRLRFFSGVLGTTGLDSGTIEQNVNGSTTAQDFYVAAAEDYDIHIMKLVFSLVDNAVTHSQWGSIGALTNGFDIFATESGQETYLVEGAVSFYDMIRQTVMAAPFGGDNTSFELSNVDGNSDAWVLPFDIASILPGGLRLGRGTTDRLTARVSDDLTGLSSQRVRVLGYRNYPEAVT